jgi:hypothetical protein
MPAENDIDFLRSVVALLATAVHIHHVFDDHPDVRSLADLPEGWAAERTSEDADWERYPWPEESE